ncbi:fimbrial protein [Atlantibacter hermannii]|uniref:fimbrial protein n=1 Tax=Atlantibacter hermannii TaxID=565 RepID=UPI001EE4D474|nr:fimbrial protein [Atlantibacter hermannii]
MDKVNFKSVLATVIIASVMNSPLAFAQDPVSPGTAAGKIHFTGDIVTPSCVINGDDGTTINVPLGTYLTTDFPKTGSKSTQKDFSISLKDCPATSAGLKRVHLTFSGETALTGNTKLLDIPGEPDAVATGVGIAITTKDAPEDYLAFDESSEVEVLLVDNGMDIQTDFYAQYVSFKDAVTAGPANADLTINILYR